MLSDRHQKTGDELVHISRFYLDLLELKHPQVREHSERVGRLAELAFIREQLQQNDKEPA